MGKPIDLSKQEGRNQYALGNADKVKIIELGIEGIIVNIGIDETGRFGGQIRSDLHSTNIDPNVTDDDELYNAAIDGIESMILGHACAGIDITTEAYKEGIKTAVDACANNL